MAREDSEPYGGGAGGKFRKRPSRKPATPYDRPSNASRDDSSSSSGAWRFSATRLIDKASGFLARFRKHPSVETDPEMPVLEVVQEASFEIPGDISNTQLHEVKEQEGSSEGDKPRDGSDNQERAGNRVGNGVDGDGIVELEQLLKEKTFSRDEFDRLAAVLHSRTIEQFEGDKERRGNPSVVAAIEIAKLPCKQRDLRTAVEENQEGPLENRVSERISSPFIPSAMHGGVSPVDVAKAYMGTKTSTVGRGSQTQIAKDGRIQSSSDISFDAPKSPICWPGAMAREDSAYVTPQSSRVRVGLHNWSETPYPRIINPGSKAAGESRHSFSVLKQPHTPVFGGSQAPKRSSVLNDGFPSIGSLHRFRQKSNLMTSSRGAGSSHFPSPVFLPLERSDASKSFLPAKESVGPSNLKIQAVENKAKRFDVGSTSVPPHSTEMARKILEHIDRSIPSPKEKLDELKLAIAKDQFPRKLTPDLWNIRGIQETGDKGKSPLQAQAESVQANIVRDSSILATGTISSMARTRYSIDSKKNGFQAGIYEVFARPDHCKDNGETQPSSHNTQTTNQDIAENVKVQRTVLSASEIKEAKIYNSTMKADGKLVVFSDSASAFTFPTSLDTRGVLGKPSPTPILMPSWPEEGISPPLFGFGSTNVSNGPVFSFTSTSSVDASTPKFDFGLEKKSNVSFSLAVAAAAAPTMSVDSLSSSGLIKQSRTGNSDWNWTASSPAMTVSSPWPTSSLTSSLPPGRASSTSGNCNNPSSVSGTFNFGGSSASFGQIGSSSSCLASTAPSNLFGTNHPVMIGSGTSMPLVSATSTVSGFGSTSSCGLSSTLSFDRSSPQSFGQTEASASSLTSTPTSNLFGTNPFLKFGAGSSSVTSSQTNLHLNSTGSLVGSSMATKFGTSFAAATESATTNAISQTSPSLCGSPFGFGLPSKSSPTIPPFFGTGNKRTLDEAAAAPLGGTSTSSSGAASSGTPSSSSSRPTFLFTAPSSQPGPFKLTSNFPSKALGSTNNQTSMEVASSSNTLTTPASADLGFTAVATSEKSVPFLSVQSSPSSHGFSAGAIDTGGDKSGRKITKINRDKRRR